MCACGRRARGEPPIFILSVEEVRDWPCDNAPPPAPLLHAAHGGEPSRFLFWLPQVISFYFLVGTRHRRGREGMSRCRHRSDCSLLRAVTTVGITRVRVPLTMISTLVPPLCQHRRKLNACHLHHTCASQKVGCSHDTRQMDSDHR